MATLALTAVGSALGGTLLPSGLLGGAISGSAIGGRIGHLVGSWVDQSLLGSGQSHTIAGPRLSDLTVTGAAEGTPIPRLYGRAKLGGQIIWGRDIEEVVTTTRSGGGGKGIGSKSVTTERTDYTYFATFAVALCEGPIASLGRIWADGQELDQTSVSLRLHLGTEDQEPDSTIAALDGPENAPAYRGIAYVVFDRLPLAQFGRRIPQLAFEVARPVDNVQQLVRGVVVIPASGEFVYATQAVTRDGDAGSRVSDNVHTRRAATDWAAALDDLQAALPNAGSVSLAVAWFGDDLSAEACSVAPRVDRAAKDTRPLFWSVAGLGRSTARIVSAKDGRPAYGGTPSDDTVVQAIRDLKARGLSVTINPMLLMDVPADNTLTDPATGQTPQPAYPWRGRITVPAASDATARAASAVRRFAGTAGVADFSVSEGLVDYLGAEEWSYRRYILHLAYLAKVAGGVDAFLIGSELSGLTKVRDGAGGYPFVSELMRIAADVKAVLGPATLVTYAADWTEFRGHQPPSATGDFVFHLDPLWASPDVDAVGIDLYWPLSDWRDGDHLDKAAGARSPYDLDYLKGNLAGGEGFDWYYADDAGRRNQRRLPITDGLGKPWLWRSKDLAGWWGGLHFDRRSGIEAASPSPWRPQSKPIWLMEIGCPAVDKGANQPNVFVDPKSSESALPWFSSGRRDDLIQRRYLQALIEGFAGGMGSPINPLSSVYGGPMIPAERIHVYAWDARPFPAFPDAADIWGDAENWRLGHWISGRLAGVGASDALRAILSEFGIVDWEVDQIPGTLQGLVVDRIMGARDAVRPLELAFFFDCVESGGTLRFQSRGDAPTTAIIATESMVESKAGAPLLKRKRIEAGELPASTKLTFLSATQGYHQAIAEARRLAGASGRVAEAQVPLVLDPEQAVEIAERWLFSTWSARERVTCTLPPSALATEPGDLVALAPGEQYRVVEVRDRGAREVDLEAFDPASLFGTSAGRRTGPGPVIIATGQPTVALLDLPSLDRSGKIGAYLAAAADPWPGPLAAYRSPSESNFALVARINATATMGRLLEELPPAAAGRRTNGPGFTVRLDRGVLSSVDTVSLFDGVNLAAVETAPDLWEVMQFQSAELVAPQTWRLSRLLRGQGGTEDLVTTVPAGARFVLIDEALAPLDVTLSEMALPWNWRVGPAARDLGHPDYLPLTGGFAGRALRPLSPVRLQANWIAGDIHLSWIRRTRIDGDSWVLAEVPLNEEAEAYDVTIGTGSAPLRTVRCAAPEFVYTTSQQIADTGAQIAALTVRVAQVSATVGQGVAATAQFSKGPGS